MLSRELSLSSAVGADRKLAHRHGAAAKAAGVQVVTPRVGEKFEFGQPFGNRAWYLP